MAELNSTEEYALFIGKLKEAIDRSLKDASLREIILKQLAFDNSNEDRLLSDLLGSKEELWNT